jgi:hypothetical protein
MAKKGLLLMIYYVLINRRPVILVKTKLINQHLTKLNN